MIEVRNLTKTFGSITAIDNISFHIHSNEVVGFLGKDGAGKSTTLNILTGYLDWDAGSILIHGYDLSRSPKKAKKTIGYLPENPPLYPEMTVWEYLDFVHRLKNITGRNIRSQIKNILEMTQLSEEKDRLIASLTKGTQQKVGFAGALCGDPDILLLDEPTAWLDPAQIYEMRNLIKELGKNHTILFSSHLLHEISAICDKVIIISKGKIVAEDTLASLSSYANHSRQLVIKCKGSEKDVMRMLYSIPEALLANFLGMKEPGTVSFMVESRPEDDIRQAIFESCAQRQIPLLEMEPLTISLEDVFLKLTSGQGGN